MYNARKDESMQHICLNIALTIALMFGMTLHSSAQTLPAPEDVLPQLFPRNHHKPIELLYRNESFDMERTIFRDPVSHLEIWKLTHDPGITIRPYYDIPFWNADGSCMILQAWRETGNQIYLMDADGGNMRPLRIPGYEDNMPSLSGLFWSNRDPHKMFFSATRDNRSYVRIYDKEKNTVTDVTWYEGAGYRLFPPHPNEEVFLMTRGRQDQSGVEAVLAFLDPAQNRPIPISRDSYHRVRFTKGDDYSVFFNSNNIPQASYFIKADGTGLTTLRGEAAEEWNRRGSHPDFSHDGQLFSVVENGYVEVRDRTGKLLKKIARINGGHGSWAYGNKYHVWEVGASSNSADSPHQGEVIMIDVDDIPKVWTIAHHYNIHAGWGTGHPYIESTHTDATASMDLTKIGYMSDMAGEFSDMYIAAVMYPASPTAPAVNSSGNTNTLTWTPPVQRTEIAGYNIYRSRTSGRGFERVNSSLITDNTFTDRKIGSGGTWYYYIASQEHSGLQGKPSAEVCASNSGNWEGSTVVSAEIETGERDANMVDQLDGRFSNNFYVELRPNRAQGSVTLQVDVPKTGSYTLFTLTKTLGSRANYWVQINDQPESLGLYKENHPAHQSGFSWTAAPQTWQLDKGRHTIRYRVNSEIVMLDKLILSDESGWRPSGDGRPDNLSPGVPQNGSAETLGVWTLGIRWDAVTDKDVRYYNVYSGTEKDFSCNQDHLVMSPSKPEVIDWGLQASRNRYTGTTYYYRITAVDYAGNESAPSALIEGRIQQPEGKPTTLDY
jgi:fibronectin type 3 domain-containing protein